MAPPRAWLAWSSGKDSAWALHEVRRTRAVDVVGLFTTISSAYQRVSIPVAVENVMSFDVDADENVYVLQRAGKVIIWKPDGSVTEAGTLDTFSGNEDGALSIVLDPNFAANHWAYIYYSSNDASENKLSRFDIHHDVLDLASEKVLLTVMRRHSRRWILIEADYEN